MTADVTSSIPFDSEPMNPWWKRGQSVEQTLDQTRAEVVADLEVERADSTVGEAWGNSWVKSAGGEMGRSIRGAQKYDDFGNRLADDARWITNTHTSAPTTAA